MNSSQVGPFFLEWLPQRFSELVEKDPGLGQTPCSLLAMIDGDPFSLSIENGTLSVTAGAKETAPTFRLHTDKAAFEQLLSNAMRAYLPSATLPEPALKLLRLDAETISLAADIPSCIKLRVVSPEGAHEVVFGPGTRSETAIGCTVECPAEALEQLQSGQADPIELFMSGRLKVDGDLQVAMALSSILL